MPMGADYKANVLKSVASEMRGPLLEGTPLLGHSPVLRIMVIAAE